MTLQERLTECFGKGFSVTTEGLDDSWMRIATPFWNDHGDQIRIFATEEGSSIRLSDDDFLCEDGEWAGLDEADIRKMAKIVLGRIASGRLAETGKESGLDMIVSPNRLGHALWDYLHFVLEMIVLIRQARKAGNAD